MTFRFYTKYLPLYFMPGTVSQPKWSCYPLGSLPNLINSTFVRMDLDTALYLTTSSSNNICWKDTNKRKRFKELDSYISSIIFLKCCLQSLFLPIYIQQHTGDKKKKDYSYSFSLYDIDQLIIRPYDNHKWYLFTSLGEKNNRNCGCDVNLKHTIYKYTC